MANGKDRPSGSGVPVSPQNNFFVCLACVTNLSDDTEIVIEVSLGVKTELAEKACCDVAVDPFSNNVLRLCGSSDCH